MNTKLYLLIAAFVFMLLFVIIANWRCKTLDTKSIDTDAKDAFRIGYSKGYEDGRYLRSQVKIDKE